MKLDKEEFLKTEVGAGLKNCIRIWDNAIDGLRKATPDCGGPDAGLGFLYWDKICRCCQAQWEVYKIVLHQFFGIEYYFSRTYYDFGLEDGDGDDWLFKIERAEVPLPKVMKLDKEEFLKTEVGAGLENCIRVWDNAIDGLWKATPDCGGPDAGLGFLYWDKICRCCQAQWEVYKIVLHQFFGIEYYFTRTYSCFGLEDVDGENWLFKIERAAVPLPKEKKGEGK